MSDDQSSLFDQRPGNLEATRGLAEWPIVAFAVNEKDAWHIAVVTGRLRLTLTIDEARRLDETLREAITAAQVAGLQ